MKEEWLMPGAVVPVTPETVVALINEIKRMIDMVGDMALQVADEREECAKVAEAYESRCDTCPSGVANAIRARGQDHMPLFDDWEGGFPYKKEQK